MDCANLFYVCFYFLICQAEVNEKSMRAYSDSYFVILKDSIFSMKLMCEINFYLQ